MTREKSFFIQMTKNTAALLQDGEEKALQA
jgi:hypothetical protein